MKQSIQNQVSNSERSDSNSKFKGVRKRNWGKWVSEIRLPNSRERIWLGSYDTAETAARAFDAALFCLRGRNAKFNFPHNPPDISGGRSLTPSEIQAEAAKFAKSEPPNSSTQSGSVPEIKMESLSSSPSPSPSQSPSISEGSATVQLDGDVAPEADRSFMDSFRTMGSGNYAYEFGLFPGFDDFSGELFSQPLIPNEEYLYPEDYVDGVIPQDSFLWNF